MMSCNQAQAPVQRRKASGIDLVSIHCPHCSTPIARIARPQGGPLAVCLACGVSGDYITLVEKGALTGLHLGLEEIERLRFTITALRDQAARSELSRDSHSVPA
jgi:hypothetical protein